MVNEYRAYGRDDRRNPSRVEKEIYFNAWHVITIININMIFFCRFRVSMVSWVASVSGRCFEIYDKRIFFRSSNIIFELMTASRRYLFCIRMGWCHVMVNGVNRFQIASQFFRDHLNCVLAVVVIVCGDLQWNRNDENNSRDKNVSLSVSLSNEFRRKQHITIEMQFRSPFFASNVAFCFSRSWQLFCLDQKRGRRAMNGPNENRKEISSARGVWVTSSRRLSLPAEPFRTICRTFSAIRPRDWRKLYFPSKEVNCQTGNSIDHMLGVI